MMDREELQRRVDQIRWYHQVRLPHGIVTPGVNASDRALRRLRLPPLDGLTVLDIGAWDGYYSFEAERRHAHRVLATDSYCWHGEGWGSKDGFLLCREALGSRVEDRDIDVMDLAPETVGSFDVVLLLGVLYHLRDPVTALERAASVCSGTLVLETEVALDFLPYPAARFFPTDELNADETNWYAYNTSALEALLKRVGFARSRVVWRTGVFRRGARAVRGARSPAGLREAFRSRRIVLHASR